MNSITIRQALPEDGAALLAYLKQIGGESDNLTFGSEGLPISVTDQEKHLEKLLTDSHSVKYLAIKDNRIVGDCTMTGLNRRMRHRAELGISVAKSEWNSGIGSALLEKTIAYAKNNGVELISLDVRADNAPAIHLYEKFGFQPIGIFPAFFKINGEYADILLMYLDLRSFQPLAGTDAHIGPK